jgi:hypothetical protein
MRGMRRGLARFEPGRELRLPGLGTESEYRELLREAGFIPDHPTHINKQNQS